MKMWDISAVLILLEIIYGHVASTPHQNRSYGTLDAQLLFSVCLNVGKEHTECLEFKHK